MSFRGAVNEKVIYRDAPGQKGLKTPEVEHDNFEFLENLKRLLENS